MKYEGAEISIPKWEKYNPRTDNKRAVWFRFENDFIVNPDYFNLSSEQKWLWIVILSLISKKNGKNIVWNYNYIKSITNCSVDIQTQTIDFFEKIGCLKSNINVTLKLHESNIEVMPEVPCATERNVTIHNNTYVMEDPKQELEQIYSGYPKRDGGQNKAKGINSLLKKYNELGHDGLESFKRAVRNYSAHCEAKKIAGTQFVKQFSSFVNPDVWREWADYEPVKEKNDQDAVDYFNEIQNRILARCENDASK